MYKPTGSMQELSFRKDPRSGQAKVFNQVLSGSSLNVQLPTGYGKTFTAVGAYSILKKNNRANRLLFIFPTDAQLEQFYKDGHNDLRDADVDGPHRVIDIRFYGANAIKKHRKNEAQVFAITVQSLIQSRGADNVIGLMEQGQWMVVVDEYHHYGLEKSWGMSVTNLPYSYLLAMSATPQRPGDDGAFGKPDVAISYSDAAKDGCVKRLKGHSYLYRIDAVLENGEIYSMTTDDLIQEAGGDSPALIEAHRINRKMRWSPKYVSPLVTIPIERMLQQRIDTGYRLQALVGAMCVSHAEMVCKQVQTLFPELSVDWVGTGDDGRTPAVNKEVLERFCPPKDEAGERNHTLDVLVHVGMAGEGLDAMNISEVSHLNAATKNNSNDQENGRAGRYLPPLKGHEVIGHINFDSTSDYRAFTGFAIMDAMDGSEARPWECGECGHENSPSATACEACDHPREGTSGNGEVPELPDEPTIQIWHMELESIDSGDPGVLRMAKIMKEDGYSLDWGSMESDPEHGGWDDVKRKFYMFRKMEAQEMDERSQIMQWKDSVNAAARVVTGRVVELTNKSGVRSPNTLAGDIKKRINRMKKNRCGAITEDIDVCRKHYTWLKELETQLMETKVVPEWLR